MFPRGQEAGMTWREKVKHFFWLRGYDFWEAVFHLRCRIWNKHLRRWWCELYIRQDEFHSSLDVDPLALMVMNQQEQSEYVRSLIKRREIVHNRDLA